MSGGAPEPASAGDNRPVVDHLLDRMRMLSASGAPAPNCNVVEGYGWRPGDPGEPPPFPEPINKVEPAPTRPRQEAEESQ